MTVPPGLSRSGVQAAERGCRCTMHRGPVGALVPGACRRSRMEPEGAIGDSQTSSRGHHAELLEACRTLTGSHGGMASPTSIAPPPVGETGFILWITISRI